MSENQNIPRFSEKRAPMDRWGNQTFLFLFHDFWFRVVLIVLLLVAAITGLFLPRIWVRTPPDFQPPLTASGLDLLQAWNLKREALKLHTAGDISGALEAWSQAELNDGGDETIPRGALKTLMLERHPSRDKLSYGYERSIHLLRLTHTNKEDLELVARYFLANGIYQYLGALVPTNMVPGPQAASAMVAAAFERGDMTGFSRLWTVYGAQLTNDLPSRLRLAAWAMEWGPAAGATAGREYLEMARKDPNQQDLANHLLLTVHLNREDVSLYQATLQDLVNRHADRPRHHIGLWRLLHRFGRGDEAMALAKRHTAPATDPTEAMEYAATLSHLGLLDISAEYLHRELASFGFDLNLWRLQARNYISMKRWDELRNLSVLMRNSNHLRGKLEGFSMFLEAFADASTGRPEAAESLFNRAAGESFGNNDLGYECALAMKSVGHPTPALSLFNTLTNLAGNDAEFWFQYTLTAGAAKDPAAVLIGAAKAYDLNPKAPNHLHNYVSALVANQVEPTKALELSIKRLQQSPDDRTAIINHVLALLLNGYTAEVESMLNSLPSNDLNPDEIADYQFAWFHFYIQTKQYPLARMAFNRIDSRRLFPTQAAWVRDARLKLPEIPDSP